MPEIIIDGLKINYKVYGKGKPFLILHGWGSNLDRWEKIAKELAKNGCRVVAPDMPGFGKSNVPETAWTIDNYAKWVDGFLKTQAEFKRNFFLLGHSFGGSLASVYSIKHPKKVKKLFLVAAAGIRKKTLKKTILAPIANFLSNFKDVPLYGVARKVFYKLIVGRTDYLTVKETMKDTYLNVVSRDLSDQLKGVSVPAVIIWGEKDNITLVEDAYYMDKVIKNSKLIVIPNAGHDLNLKQPEILAKEILNNL